MNAETYPSFYKKYIQEIPEMEADKLLDESLKETFKSLAMVNEEQASIPYAENKWTIKDILQHLMDTERIFCFRALAFARGEKKPLIGFDHEAYAKQAKANSRSLKSLLEEFKQVRLTTKMLFSSFQTAMFYQSGWANDQELTVAQLQMLIIGHHLHHLKVIERKYLYK